MLPAKSSEILHTARHLNFTVEMQFGRTNYENFKLPGKCSEFCVSSWHMNSSLVTWKLQSTNFKVPGKCSEFCGSSWLNIENSTSCQAHKIHVFNCKIQRKIHLPASGI